MAAAMVDRREYSRMRFVAAKASNSAMPLQDMVFSELACFVSRNQVPEELVSVIGQIAPPPRR
jgi:hypothetical protein